MKKQVLLFVIIFACIFSACEKIKAPELSRYVTIGKKTPYAIHVSCVIYDEGNDVITEKGFCYNVGGYKAPTYTDCDRLIPVDNILHGYFETNISGLQPDTEYTIVAYAMNSVDTTYSWPAFVKTNE